MTLQVGITGNMGSGKSTVCGIFAELGIPIYDADSRAKGLMLQNPLKSHICALLGDEAYLPNGELNRPYIASMAFSNSETLLKLNALVHPAVATDAQRWHKEQANVPYTLREAALLVESGSYKQLDYLILVSAPESIRIERVVKRDHTSREDAILRMQKQLPEAQKAPLAHFIIINDGISALIPQVLGIHQALLVAAKGAS